MTANKKIVFSISVNSLSVAFLMHCTLLFRLESSKLYLNIPDMRPISKTITAKALQIENGKNRT